MKHIKFLFAVWQANLQSVMEYRISFITQVVGMMLNNFIYFAIWIIFFDRFKDVRGWGVNDMYVTYGILASAFGLVSILFGSSFFLSDIIAKGRLDYYLTLPRPVLLHTIASRSIASGMGGGMSRARRVAGVARGIVARPGVPGFPASLGPGAKPDPTPAL